jgi:hypothetical protein
MVKPNLVAKAGRQMKSRQSGCRLNLAATEAANETIKGRFRGASNSN